MTCPACHKTEPCTCSTTQRLSALGMWHRATGRGYEHAVFRPAFDGDAGPVEVFRGTVHDVEAWLRQQWATSEGQWAHLIQGTYLRDYRPDPREWHEPTKVTAQHRTVNGHGSVARLRGER